MDNDPTNIKVKGDFKANQMQSIHLIIHIQGEGCRKGSYIQLQNNK